MKNYDLKDELRARGKATTGKKKSLVHKLMNGLEQKLPVKVLKWTKSLYANKSGKDDTKKVSNKENKLKFFHIFKTTFNASGNICNNFQFV